VITKPVYGETAYVVRTLSKAFIIKGTITDFDRVRESITLSVMSDQGNLGEYTYDVECTFSTLEEAKQTAQQWTLRRINFYAKELVTLQGLELK
jgi:hypothetical protein